MKVIQSSFFRALCSIVVGVMLIRYPDNTVTWLTMAIGVLFFLSGAISCISYFVSRRNASEYTITDSEGRVIVGNRPTFPIVGMGSLILGLLLALTPSVFVKGLMYVIGVVLVLGAINQFMALSGARRLFRMPFVFWICPSIVFLTGIFVMVKPMESASLPMLILGWCSLLYGVTEIINALKISAGRRRLEREKPVETESSVEGTAEQE